MTEDLGRRRFLKAAGTAGIAALAGCGGNGSNGTPTSGGTSGGTDQQNTGQSTPTETNSDENTPNQSLEIDNGILTEMPSYNNILGTIEETTRWNGDIETYEQFDQGNSLNILVGKNPRTGAVGTELAGNSSGKFEVQINNGAAEYGADIYEIGASEIVESLEEDLVKKEGYWMNEEPSVIGNSGREVVVGIKDLESGSVVAKVHSPEVEGTMSFEDGMQWIRDYMAEDYPTHAEDVEEFMNGGQGSGNLAMDVGGALVYQNPRIKGASILPLMGENGMIDTDGDGFRDAEEYLSSLDRQAGQ
jgi:hypothetical protein